MPSSDELVDIVRKGRTQCFFFPMLEFLDAGLECVKCFGTITKQITLTLGKRIRW